MSKSIRPLFMRVGKKLRAELEALVTVEDPNQKDGYGNGCKLLDGDLPDLCGACMYGSIMVFNALKELGRDPRLVEGDGHWFTHCDGYLIDITASQFGMKDVEVRLIDAVDDKTQRFWVPVKITKSIRRMHVCFIQYADEIEEARKIIKQNASV